jgi:hypothetical protein
MPRVPSQGIVTATICRGGLADDIASELEENRTVTAFAEAAGRSRRVRHLCRQQHGQYCLCAGRRAALISCCRPELMFSTATSINPSVAAISPDRLQSIVLPRSHRETGSYQSGVSPLGSNGGQPTDHPGLPPRSGCGRQQRLICDVSLHPPGSATPVVVRDDSRWWF